MKLTTNYSLKKPEGSDVVNIEDFNHNADIIDSEIKAVKNQSNENKTSISKLNTKVDIGQNYKLTQDSGDLLNLNNVDINNITTTCYGEGMVINGPTNDVYTIESYMSRGGAYGHQVATYWFGTHSRYFRFKSNGNWSAWRLL